MRTFLVELDRFRSRRAVVLVLLAGAVLTALLAGTAVWDSRPVSAAEHATARARAAADAADPGFKRELATCRRHPGQFFGPGGTARQCTGMLTPRPENYLARRPLSLAEQQHDRGLTQLVLLAALSIIVGATFAGGDWASGSMSNQLLFEPRRTRVWLAKAAAVTVGTLVASGVLVAGFWASLYLTAEARGLPLGASVQEQVRWLAARGVLLAGFAGLGGFALTMLLRHTVGTLALLFAYVVGGEALVALLPVDRAGQWSLAQQRVRLGAQRHPGLRRPAGVPAEPRRLRPLLPGAADARRGLPRGAAGGHAAGVLAGVPAARRPLIRGPARAHRRGAARIGATDRPGVQWPA